MDAPPTGASSGTRLAPDRTLVKVAVAFAVIYAVLHATLYALTYWGYLEPVMKLTADITGACSNATGLTATVQGNDVVLASRILRIDPDCTGITLMIMYSALVLAYPLSTKRKLLGLVIGIPVIAAANLARLFAVAQLSGVLSDNVFFFVHDYLFKVLMVAVVIVLWALYLASARRRAAQ